MKITVTLLKISFSYKYGLKMFTHQLHKNNFLISTIVFCGVLFVYCCLCFSLP